MESYFEVEPNTVLESCGSTNQVARSLAERGAPHGTWISSQVQTSGRGRLGRRWESSKGNLFLSLVVRNLPVERWSWIPLATAVGVQKALQIRFPMLPVQIKWPNDLWIGNAKLGGILCEGGGPSSATGTYVIVGIGLNCRSAPEGLARSTLSLTEALGGQVTDADEVRLAIKDSVLQSLEQLEKRVGTEVIQQEYEKAALFQPGRSVEWGDAGDQKGTVIGLGPHSELRVRSASGEICKLFADEVQLRIV